MSPATTSPVSPVVMSTTVPEVVEQPVERRRIRFQTVILFGLNRLNKHIYEGTVPAHVKARRRAKGKAARKARRAHR